MHLGSEGCRGHVHIGKMHEYCHTRRACAMRTSQTVNQHTPSLQRAVTGGEEPRGRANEI
jgi:hypothetical protein